MTERTHPGEVPGAEAGSWTHEGRAVRSDGGKSADGLFEVIPDPTVEYAVDGDRPSVHRVNRAYEQRFGADGGADGGLERRLRTDLGRSEPGEDLARVDAIVELVEAAATDDPMRTIVQGHTDDGERDYLARVVVEGENVSSLDGYVVLTDVTPMRERTRELIEQRDRLDEFASIVSHDLRNPLEVAKIQMEAAQNRGDDVHFEKVSDAHERMERIIEDVLTLARQGQVIDEVGNATLSIVAEDAWNSISAPGADLVVAEDARLKADADRLQEILENLFRNAIEHGGPEVTVTVGRTDDGFYVADTGPGIPAEDQDRVFEGGFSTSADGTGLGLVIVERIADAHGWGVGASTAESGGARFDFSGVRVLD